MGATCTNNACSHTANALDMPLVHHATKVKQQNAVESLSGVHDEAFFEAQLLRSISLALSAVGFDSVKPTALEAFRAEVVSFMQYYLNHVCHSMQSSRRTEPTPQDFISALVGVDVLSHELIEQVKLRLPAEVTQPPIAPADHDDPPSKPLDGLLGSQLADPATRRKWIPAHLPELPSKHTYQHTPIYTKRENNARRIRELATEEGVMAEQAMRKLLIKGGHGHAKIPFATKKAEQVWGDTMAAMMDLDNEQRAREDEGDFEDFGDRQLDEYDTAMLVNYESRYWRSGARGP